jgi:hypothetical protein
MCTEGGSEPWQSGNPALAPQHRRLHPCRCRLPPLPLMRCPCIALTCAAHAPLRLCLCTALQGWPACGSWLLQRCNHPTTRHARAQLLARSGRGKLLQPQRQHPRQPEERWGGARLGAGRPQMGRKAGRLYLPMADPPSDPPSWWMSGRLLTWAGRPAPRRFLQAWLWRVEGQDVFFEKSLPLRFKVQTVRFHPVPTLAEQQEQVGGWRSGSQKGQLQVVSRRGGSQQGGHSNHFLRAAGASSSRSFLGRETSGPVSKP